MSGDHGRQGARGDDQYYWLTAFLAAAGMRTAASRTIAATILTLGAIPLLLMLTPQGPRGLSSQLLAAGVAVGCGLMAWRWLRPWWPTPTESKLCGAAGAAFIAAACLIQANPLVGLLGATAFSVLNGITALLHSPTAVGDGDRNRGNRSRAGNSVGRDRRRIGGGRCGHSRGVERLHRRHRPDGDAARRGPNARPGDRATDRSVHPSRIRRAVRHADRLPQPRRRPLPRRAHRQPRRLLGCDRHGGPGRLQSRSGRRWPNDCEKPSAAMPSSPMSTTPSFWSPTCSPRQIHPPSPSGCAVRSPRHHCD